MFLELCMVSRTDESTAYDRVEDVDGILSCLERKAMLFRYRGDDGLAEEVDKMYEAEMDEARKREDEARGKDIKQT